MNARLGVIIVNLGSPESPAVADVRRYLDEFLGDPLVVDANPFVWRAIRKAIVLPLRGPKSARLYERIWTERGSPLVALSGDQADALARLLGPECAVRSAMRYGRPSIRAALEELRALGCGELVILPAFPQYSRTTTGTIEVRLTEELRALDWSPAVTVVPPYFEHAAYIGALAESCRRELERGSVEHFVFSFHGLPERYVAAGDPYRDHCERTAHALSAALGLADADWTLAFQSRFGPGRWLGPDVAQWLPERAQRYPRVLLACPGFAVDCLETLEEIQLRLSEDFLQAGGEELRVVPCLNASPEWIAAMRAFVEEARRPDAATAAHG